MASFGLSRAHGAAAIARESRAGKYLPLYLAGLAAGAIGVVLTFVTSGDDTAVVRAPAAFEAQVAGPFGQTGAEVPSLTGTVEPTPLTPGAALSTFPELPPNLLAGLASPAVTVPAVAEPPAPAPEPVAAPPVAVAPASPVAPAVVPVAEEPAVAPAAAPGKPNFYVPEPGAGAITDLEQRLLNGINAERANAGLAPYALDAGLSRIARMRVQQLVDQNYFGHTDLLGYSMYTELLAHFGYTSYAWTGENLALNNYGVTESPERAVADLMTSPTHRANLLAGDFFHIGVGELTTADGGHFYAVIFLG
jgi:uncharacterized protein YkwD